MRIVVLSDTHIPNRARALPQQLLEAFKEADLVLHAGDITNNETLDKLKQLPRFVGVAGNMDSPGVRCQLNEQEILELEGLKICLVHGWGAPGPLPDKLRKHFERDDPDIIIFGHSHRAFKEKTGNNVLMFNPGSASCPDFSSNASYGIIEIDRNTVKPDIVRIT